MPPDAVTYEYALPTLALSKSGTVEDVIFLSACNTSSRSLCVMIALEILLVNTESAVLYLNY